MMGELIRKQHCDVCLQAQGNSPMPDSPSMSPDEIIGFVTTTYQDVHIKQSWGEVSMFVNPGKQLPSGTYFATLKQRDGPNDKASNLDRNNVFRFNLGLGKILFEPVFGTPPPRPAKGQIIEGAWDFTILDKVMPHPVYGWMSWICVLNPSLHAFHHMRSWIDGAYQRAQASCRKRLAKLEHVNDP